jgi:ABC-type multidrug transport system fused ATPase/permease subunit
VNYLNFVFQVALLRITEIAEGDIVIDGINTKSLSLSDLRSRIAVIPQEPVLLTGTIRSNLDPFNSRSDAAVWQAVRSVHLGAKIENLPLKLDTAIIENGRTFTLAERQLFCIARAILMNTKVVIFDGGPLFANNLHLFSTYFTISNGMFRTHRCCR